MLDCLIVGGGPAGLTAALYLARFNRRFLMADTGASRAASIPASHNIPFFPQGVAGREILERQKQALRQYGDFIVAARVARLSSCSGRFEAILDLGRGKTRLLIARRVLLATGSLDVEPDLPDLPDAVQRGLIRYCPICDGFEASGKKIGVIGHGSHGVGEAIFIARTYSDDVTLLTLGNMELSQQDRQQLDRHGVKAVHEPVESLEICGEQVTAIRIGGTELRFDVLYSALGLKRRSELAVALGAEHDESGAIIVDDHNQTTVRGLFAAGGVVRGLDQVVVAMGHAAVAATHIHNLCEIPTEDEAGA